MRHMTLIGISGEQWCAPSITDPDRFHNHGSFAIHALYSSKEGLPPRRHSPAWQGEQSLPAGTGQRPRRMGAVSHGSSDKDMRAHAWLTRDISMAAWARRPGSDRGSNRRSSEAYQATWLPSGKTEAMAIAQCTTAAIVEAANPAARSAGDLAPHSVAKL